MEAARQCWVRGHPLLSEIANRGCRSQWLARVVREVFGNGYYARSNAQNAAEELQFRKIERHWQQAGRAELPQYFEAFGVINARQYVQDQQDKALAEAKNRQSRPPTRAEVQAIELLSEITSELAPEMMVAVGRGKASYCVAETETILGELKERRAWRSYEVFLAADVFGSDFAEALGVFLHEHAHIFGHDGSREFGDALTDLIVATVRCRQQMDEYEKRWERVRRQVAAERRSRGAALTDRVSDLLGQKGEMELRQILTKVPKAILLQILGQAEKD